MSELKQLNLYGPSLNPVSRLKAAMRQGIKESKYSRAEIVDRMNLTAKAEGLKLGRSDQISIDLLDAWVAESKENQIPLQLLPAFCDAAQTILPMRVIVGCLGAELVDSREAKILHLARIDFERRRLARERKRVQREIEEAS